MYLFNIIYMEVDVRESYLFLEIVGWFRFIIVVIKNKNKKKVLLLKYIDKMYMDKLLNIFCVYNKY